MAGPGIRYQNLAAQMQRVAKVTLGIYSADSASKVAGTNKPEIQSVKTTGNSYKALFNQHDIIFAQWLSGEMLRYAKSTGKIVIIDLYAPVPIEYLASLGFSGKPVDARQDLEYSGVLETYKQYLSLADYCVCSNERQRDFWLGFITSANILTPTNFPAHAKMENLALCPMGISSHYPTKRSTTLKLREQLGLKKTDFVLLWTGGIWDWFDAQVIIKAVHSLSNPDIKLVFLGTKHPNTAAYTEEMSESQAARALAEKLKVTDKTVFFLDGWVDYDQRASYLMDADVAIHADKESLETRLSHRTRVLDNLWAGLPTICNRGDYLAQVLEERGLGMVVADRRTDSFAAAIKQAYGDPKALAAIKANIERARGDFTWEALTKDLLNFIEHCQPGQVTGASDQPATAAPAAISSSQRVKRRVKNAIKVLIGRIDV